MCCRATLTTAACRQDHQTAKVSVVHIRCSTLLITASVPLARLKRCHMLSTLEQTPNWVTADDCAIKWLMSLAQTLCSKKIIVWAVWYGHYSGISSSAATCGRAIHFPPLLLHRELYKILAVVLKCHKICTEKLKNFNRFFGKLWLQTLF